MNLNDVAGLLGLTMLLLLGYGTLYTGLPIWAVLTGTASLFACLGLMLGVFDTGLLDLMPARIVGLLEHDLLQAMPLYVLLGVLMQKLPLTLALHRCAAYALQSLGLPTAPAALLVGGVFAPMNGSVASSALMLKRMFAHSPHTAKPESTALLAAASTIGVVVPPSLVLLLLGDAMMRAHLEAVKLSPVHLAGQQIIQTHDVFKALILPALVIFVLWFVTAVWRARSATFVLRAVAPSRQDLGLTVLTLVSIGGLLGSVFTGKLFAVEAAATGCCALLLGTAISRTLNRTQWREMLQSTLEISGALFAILLAATTFSLVLRSWGSDTWTAQALSQLGATPLITAILILLIMAVCAWVLDAFEMIFVVIPIVAPLLIAQLGDAQQAAVLLLLVLQTSFLLPPLGYAVIMVKPVAQSLKTLLPALVPYMLAPLLMIVCVLIWPESLRLLNAPSAPVAAVLSEEDIAKAMNAVGENAAVEAAVNAK